MLTMTLGGGGEEHKDNLAPYTLYSIYRIDKYVPKIHK